MNTPLHLERQDNVALVTLNRPDAFNAFDETLLREFSEAMAALAHDTTARAVVITGAGRAFCAGGDLKYILAAQCSNYTAFHRLAGLFHNAVTDIVYMPKPVIAAVNGVAAGGGFSLALACDFRVMARSASLKCAYGAAGLTLDGGGSWTLPRLVGRARALEIALLDPILSAEECHRLGLATRVSDDGAALPDALEMARKLAAGSMHATGWAKKLIAHSYDAPLERQLEEERRGIATCGEHPDGVEGMQAFAAKRPPAFG